MDVENYIFFGLKLGSGFEETGDTPGGTPPPRIPRTPLPPPSPEVKQLNSCDNSIYSIISVCYQRSAVQAILLCVRQLD